MLLAGPRPLEVEGNKQEEARGEERGGKEAEDEDGALDSNGSALTKSRRGVPKSSGGAASGQRDVSSSGAGGHSGYAALLCGSTHESLSAATSLLVVCIAGGTLSRQDRRHIEVAI
jgi:hypothetical protein